MLLEILKTILSVIGTIVFILICVKICWWLVGRMLG